MKFQVGREPPLPGTVNHTTVMTQIETSIEAIHKVLSIVEENQTHHRLREAEGKKRAEDLNWRVTWWGFMETLLIFIVSTAQVVIVKHFFTYSSPFRNKV